MSDEANYLWVIVHHKIRGMEEHRSIWNSSFLPESAEDMIDKALLPFVGYSFFSVWCVSLNGETATVVGCVNSRCALSCVNYQRLIAGSYGETNKMVLDWFNTEIRPNIPHLRESCDSRPVADSV